MVHRVYSRSRLNRRIIRLNPKPPNRNRLKRIQTATSQFKTMLLGPHLWKKEQQSILLVVVPITIRNEDKTFDTFALLDSGSEATLIVEHAAKAIELEGTSRPTRFGTFHGNDPEIDATVVRFSVSPRSDPTLFHTSNSLVVPYLNLSRKKCNWPREKMHHRVIWSRRPCPGSTGLSTRRPQDVINFYLDIQFAITWTSPLYPFVRCLRYLLGYLYII